jgi:hypothetical protein
MSLSVSRFSLHGRTKHPKKGEAKAPVGPEGAADGAVAITAQARDTLVREAAYRRAQRRGFAPGHELADWLEAEHEIDEHPASG